MVIKSVFIYDSFLLSCFKGIEFIL